MEHRWWNRLATDLEVDVVVRDRGTFPGRVENIGLGGMYLRMATEGLAERELLELIMPEHEGHRCRIQAWIVHRDGGGVGLAFNSFGEGDYECLKRFIEEGALQLPEGH